MECFGQIELRRIGIQVREPLNVIGWFSGWVLNWAKLCTNRFQIQMETPQEYLQVSEERQCVVKEELLERNEWEAHDQEQEMIMRALAESQGPFVVECHSPESNHLQQEMIKQKILSYNRKEKSLEELSRKFIDNFQGGKEVLLELDKVTVQLSVERRRIYDIVNIFESLQVVRKVAKNNYVWRGLRQAVNTIHGLAQKNLTSYHPKREKSLEHLASRFLELFITTPTPLSLQQAAPLLVLTQDSALAKTKIRRLYDIVNVFKSVGLVEKTQSLGKKPAFRWLGTKGLQRIIQQREKINRQGSQEREKSEGYGCRLSEKQNSCQIPNLINVNDWFSRDERKAFTSLGFMKEFSQKLFYPSIIRNENSLVTTISASQQSLNDICSQY